MSDMRHIRDLVNDLLAANRPDRYTIGNEGETKWLNDIADDIEPLIPEAEAKKLLAGQIVVQQEAKATKRANRFLRDFARTGQLPLLWVEEGAWPLSVVSIDPNDPKKTIEERVALRAVTVLDARAFANEERRRAAKDFAARNETCVGAEMAADEAQTRKLDTIWQFFAVLGTPDDPGEE